MHSGGRRGTLKWARCLTFYPSLFYPGTGIVWRTWIRHPLWSLSTTHSLSLENKCFEGRGLFSCPTVYSDLNGIILLKENALGRFQVLLNLLLISPPALLSRSNSPFQESRISLIWADFCFTPVAAQAFCDSFCSHLSFNTLYPYQRMIVEKEKHCHHLESRRPRCQYGWALWLV